MKSTEIIPHISGGNAKSSGIWESLLGEKEFGEEMRAAGYCKERSFISYKEQYNLQAGLRTPAYLSIDFFSSQPPELRARGYFVIRTGTGKFMIFDEKRFDKPYLCLDLRQAVNLKGNYPSGFEHLKKAFRDNMIENAAIERLWFGGIFVQLLRFGSEENHGFIGPRGTRRSSFDVYFREKEGSIVKAFTYSGQEELDYSIFTENCIYFFEGKSTPAKRGLDIGWHKIAYPANRFMAFNKRLIPCYFLQQGMTTYFVIFPDFEFYKGSIVLNDVRRFTPKRIFRIGPAD